MKRAEGSGKKADGEVEGFIDKFDTENQALIREVRKALRQRLRGANELVYDNYNFFVIGYSPSERPSDAILSLVADHKGVRIAFAYTGTRLPDPKKVLRGSGTQNRFVPIASAREVVSGVVDALITASTKLVKAPLRPDIAGKTIVRSISAKQRPRKKAAGALRGRRRGVPPLRREKPTFKDPAAK